jgi:hypothetical protein
MSSFPGSPRVLKGAFVYFASQGAQPKIIAFQYNPETLCRKLERDAIALGSSSSSSLAPTSPIPRQVISLTLALDAADGLEFPDENPQVVRSGLHPSMSAIEILMYSSASAPSSLTLFVWGVNRVVPVRVMQVQIVEQMFDPSLNPIRAAIAVTLLVRTHADFSDAPWARKYWDNYLAKLQELAESASAETISELGLPAL